MVLVLYCSRRYIGADVGDIKRSPTDVFVIMAVVLLNTILGVVQESKAEKAIEALRELASPTSKVIRDGKLTVVKTEEIVVGDIVVLDTGDSVPADGRIIECASMKCDEARADRRVGAGRKDIRPARVEGEAAMCRSATASTWSIWAARSFVAAAAL